MRPGRRPAFQDRPDGSEVDVNAGVRPGPGAGVTAGQHQQPGPDVTGEAGALGARRSTRPADRHRGPPAHPARHRRQRTAGQLSPGNLAALRALRADLDPVFAATTIEEEVNHLDPLMRGAVVPARLSAGAGTAVWACGAGQEGMAACAAACSLPSPITSSAAAPHARASATPAPAGACTPTAAAATAAASATTAPPQRPTAGDAITRPPKLRPVTSPLVRSSLAAPRGGPRPGGKG
jgi:hypothetical protein